MISKRQKMEIEKIEWWKKRELMSTSDQDLASGQFSYFLIFIWWYCFLINIHFCRFFQKQKYFRINIASKMKNKIKNRNIFCFAVWGLYTIMKVSMAFFQGYNMFFHVTYRLYTDGGTGGELNQKTTKIRQLSTRLKFVLLLHLCYSYTSLSFHI